MSSLQDTYTPILEGHLTKSPPFEASWKRWRRRYFVLYGDALNMAPLLAYYESKEAFASNQRYKDVICLDDCMNIYKHDDTLFEREDVISLETSPFSKFKGRVFHLAPDPDLGSREYQRKWVEEIKKRLIKLGSRNRTGSSGYASYSRSSFGSRTSTRSRFSFDSIRSRASSRSSRWSAGFSLDCHQPALTGQDPVEHVNRPEAAEHDDDCIPEEETKEVD